MNENPYQSPVAHDKTPVEANNRFSDRAIARRMLDIHRHGYSLGLFLRWNGREHLLLVVYFALLLGGLAYLDLWMPFYMMLGILVGRVGRDMAWVRASSKSWPFSDKVIDWEKVQQLADE